MEDGSCPRLRRLRKDSAWTNGDRRREHTQLGLTLLGLTLLGLTLPHLSAEADAHPPPKAIDLESGDRSLPAHVRSERSCSLRSYWWREEVGVLRRGNGRAPNASPCCCWRASSGGLRAMRSVWDETVEAEVG